jgi:hypothetical protein
MLLVFFYLHVQACQLTSTPRYGVYLSGEWCDPGKPPYAEQWQSMGRAVVFAQVFLSDAFFPVLVKLMTAGFRVLKPPYGLVADPQNSWKFPHEPPQGHVDSVATSTLEGLLPVYIFPQS